MAEDDDGAGRAGAGGESRGFVRDIGGVGEGGADRAAPLERLQEVLDGTAAGPERSAAPEGPAGPRRRAQTESLRHRIATEPDTVERDLIKLVLTVVELVRQLMERQALRRVEVGDLTEDQEERIGMTLMLLEERMTELRDRYGLTASDLNLDLGPLGSLLPRAEE
ncbi:gas vesicle protein K [Streptomonospora sp. PA3]|uniref:gas vesicle protein K n=1 Tax=Streptomonospora sp. PA3 TaxID=2607326 RepID=UPI001CA43341|nr:gas vesicle protein K [Streptomonospora sp. PA3]